MQVTSVQYLTPLIRYTRYRLTTRPVLLLQYAGCPGERSGFGGEARRGRGRRRRRKRSPSLRHQTTSPHCTPERSAHTVRSLRTYSTYIWVSSITRAACSMLNAHALGPSYPRRAAPSPALNKSRANGAAKRMVLTSC